jgi:hypothetical protein
LKKIAAYKFKQAHDHERTAILNLLPELNCRRSLSNGLRAPRKNHGSSPSILKHSNMENSHFVVEGLSLNYALLRLLLLLLLLRSEKKN